STLPLRIRSRTSPVTTWKLHGWVLSELGARIASSRISRISALGTGRFWKPLMLRRPRTTSSNFILPPRSSEGPKYGRRAGIARRRAPRYAARRARRAPGGGRAILALDLFPAAPRRGQGHDHRVEQEEGLELDRPAAGAAELE